MRRLQTIAAIIAAAIATSYSVDADAAPTITNLLTNGSFEGPTGATPAGWTVGGTAHDGYYPVTIAYNQASNYPTGAQGEAVPTDNAPSLSPDGAGANGVYFVSDEAKNLSLYQYVTLTPGSYDIGFDSFDTINGGQQPHDAVFDAMIAGVDVAHFDLASVSPGAWTTHGSTADITKAGRYLVAFTFNTPDTPANADPANPGGLYNAKDVVIDRAYITASRATGGVPIPGVPEPAGWMMLIAGFGGIGAALRHGRRGYGLLGAIGRT